MSDIDNLDSVIPSDFPRTLVNKILGKVVSSKYGGLPLGDHFIDSWTAVVYRFSSCAEHDIAYQDSFRRVGSLAPRLEQYIQERELFGFFVCGLTVIESFYYSCYILASMENSSNFPMNDLKKIQPSATADKFIKFYAGEMLTISLDELRNSNEFRGWSDIRNTLAHRIVPARLNKVTIWPAKSTSSYEVSWMNDTITLDADTTSLRRTWLAKVLDELMTAADDFTSSHFS